MFPLNEMNTKLILFETACFLSMARRSVDESLPLFSVLSQINPVRLLLLGISKDEF
jgi:hypothetical protein